MIAADLVLAVETAGGFVTLRDGRPVVSGPLGALPDELVEQLRAHRTEVIAHLMERRAGPVHTAWAEGVARCRTMPVPPAFVGKDWPEPLLSDAERFLAEWGTTAARLGWPDWALWGVQRRVPSSCRGRELVALLGGCPVVALTATEAVIAVRPGINHVYRRPERDPLHPAERCLLWELA